MNVYHGRRSYELAFEVERGTERYSMSELLRVADPQVADAYRNRVATTPGEVVSGTLYLADLVKRYGERALSGDASVFDMLRSQRSAWSEEYALDVLARQLKPRAEAAFREGRYREAVELYEQIYARLSPADLKKLQLARRRS